ncbi:hypothetical protein SSP24_18240 [Streptomyces spinoverrucosus]|uniref:DUF899 domain-containing protein n=1 Tax=Streptomyces spinoverrucosus TaxID=284043 RepID=A0A4Y3VEN1_9ACTN|nr:DUF899 domain-containing protein [Streptomyces spinoverrucosus]GEC04169.1 hypothetical protein SSP24_18240 [Streptomyces spinoverrucosus]GHB46667.1 hypothetical protein GCM10010397_15710 [Streptomyces spinoverrucosus]
MSLPEIASREEWRTARQELLLKEKAATRARDALNAERRRLPMVEVDTEYVFEGGDGKATLLDLFEGRHQLIVYHFMFAPEWDTGCRSCSAFLDQVGHLAHLHARGTTFAAVSRAPYTRILPFKARMGWTLPWYSASGDDFNRDFEATVEHEGQFVERPGVSCFLRDRDRVFHTYSTYERGLDGLGSTTSFLDLTALGRQEEWEEPKGRASAFGAPAGSKRIRYHDEYEE